MEVPKAKPVILMRFTQAYLIFCILIFGFAAVGKLTSNFADPSMVKPDPFLIWLTNKQLLFIAAGVEVIGVVALGFLCVKNPFKGLLVALWLCSMFVVY